MTTTTTRLHPEDYSPPRPRVIRSRQEVVEYWTRLYAQANVDRLVLGDGDEVTR